MLEYAVKEWQCKRAVLDVVNFRETLTRMYTRIGYRLLVRCLTLHSEMTTPSSVAFWLGAFTALILQCGTRSGYFI